MRRVRYQVAVSLDGYIADAGGGTDWIVEESGIDFKALFDQFDTLLMGRRTYEDALKRGSEGFWGKKAIVFSRTLEAADHPGVEVVSTGAGARVQQLRAESGKDIWLFGGGELLRALLAENCVDTIEPAIVPVLVGGGTPFLATPAALTRLSLTSHRVFPSGIVWLEYAVQPKP
ncbi:dihydrofolate reductase [Planctomycetaceae bacterium]|nr:dihydrofolate reductase [Planctomycetaceae bacterium]